MRLVRLWVCHSAERAPVTKYLKGREVLTNDPEDGVDLDSDCEGDLTEAGDGTLEEKTEEEPRAVLIAGSFSA